MTGFMLVCTVLYFSHAVYFNKNSHLFSIIESIYAFCMLQSIRYTIYTFVN
ncbi:hypothetical protein JCM6292_2976 [Bacteroides pyogenes JCM 6292]|uniref:Uncharacterized protein n=2 Tax=Bacteroides pyogenes TaxID=310300 RepID=W4PJ89_9BACE|nr:hypothetical protein JCM6292_2976 [Bacteroides pyogenes JCM 6292]GAE19852.1 hypothetical protein JCM6294_2963 [Bacteroides pyogenes DSM 20611 = JCM 6294]